MNDLTDFVHHFTRTPLKLWARSVPEQLEQLYNVGHGDLPRWQAAVAALPDLVPEQIELQHSYNKVSTFLML